MIVRMPPMQEILERWREIEPLLRRATKRTEGCYEPADVLGMVYAGRCKLLLIEDEGQLLVVVATELRTYPRRRVLDASFIGGALDNPNKLSDWVPLLVQCMEDMARAGGATLLSGCGRIGWARAAGFRINGGFVTRPVKDEP